ADAMVSGLAPGRAAPTEIVGKSTCGRGATGKKLNATAPERKIAIVISDVATGRRMNGAEKLEVRCTLISRRRAGRLSGLFHGIANPELESLRKPIESQINDWRGIQRQQLTQNQATHN